MINDDTDGEVQVPITEACESCFVAGVDILKYPSFFEFSIAHSKSAKVRAQVEEIKRRIGQIPEPKGSMPGEEVAASDELSIEISQWFTGVRESDVKSELDATRLTKTGTINVPTVSVPNLWNVALKEHFCLFTKEKSGSSSSTDEKDLLVSSEQFDVCV